MAVLLSFSMAAATIIMRKINVHAHAFLTSQYFTIGILLTSQIGMFLAHEELIFLSFRDYGLFLICGSLGCIGNASVGNIN